MQKYKLTQGYTTLFYDEATDMISLHCVETEYKYTFAISFTKQQMLDFMIKHRICEVHEDFVLYDVYAEDEEGITQMDTHSILLKDYLYNYISVYELEYIIKYAVEEFTNQF